MEFHLIKHNGVFKAADYDSEDAVKKIGEGEVVKAKSMSQRNYGHHKKFFVLMRFGFHHKPEWMDEYFSNSKRGKENFRKEVIKAAGYYHYEYDFNGNKKKVADSIAFDNMDQEVLLFPILLLCLIAAGLFVITAKAIEGINGDNNTRPTQSTKETSHKRQETV
jgi:hypothetical protein